MNSIGNDNYKPGLVPPQPMKQGSGWLSSNMAQLMVFINGLILTITAFATLSVFIDEIVKDGLLNTTDEVQQYIVDGYNKTERSLSALSAVVAYSDDEPTSRIKNYLQDASSGAKYFDQIFWIRMVEGKWNLIPLLNKKTYQHPYSNSQDFIDFSIDQVTNTSNNLNLITSFPQAQNPNPQLSDDINSLGQPFAMIKVLGELNSPIGYLVGVSRLGNIVETKWLGEKESVSSTQVVDVKADLPIYNYTKFSKGQSLGAARYMNVFGGNFANKEFVINVEVAINAREAFLQKIPLLMLLFGITLTLIGTLYVRNNQSQSQKLSEMNKELAHKNFELNQEMAERERLNNVIQKSARENRAVINAVSDIIFEASTDGTLLFLNDSWKVVTGFERERSIGRNLFDLIHTQDQDDQRQNFDQLVKGQKKSYRAFTRLRSVDGTFRAVELAISMMRQDENKEMRVVGTITDVEDRRRAERALSEAEKKYRAIVENAAGGIYQVTPEGQFLSANPAFSRIIGYSSPEEVLRDINHAQEQIYIDIAAHSKFLRDVALSENSLNYECQIKRKDGAVIWVNENIRAVKDDDGTLLFYEGSMEDIDKRKKAEIALKDAKTSSDLANRAKSEFLANMSHELRTPLNSVIGFSEIIKNESFGAIAQAEYKEYATSIYDSGNSLLKVINEILDVSRIEAGERTLNESVVNVKSVMASCLELMDGKFKANKMRIDNKVKDSTLAFVGEVQAVKQMLLNLMSNAVKFSPSGGFIMLDAEISPRGRLRLSVTDTGIGMTEAELEKALSPFGQVDTEMNRSGSGTGLGLTLVKSLIELHGGSLELVSQKNIGTTATLIFPEKRVVKKDVAKAEGINAAEENKQPKDA